MSKTINNQTLSIERRIELLESLKSWILKNEVKINEALKLDLNKSKQESYLTEIGPILAELNLMLKNIKKWTKPKKVKTPLFLFKSSSKIYPEPYGKVLIIGAWNYPFQLILIPLIGAIGAGNKVVVKPSEVSPNSCQLLSSMIQKIFKSNEVKVVNGGPKTTSKLLDQKFDFIFFTGSTKVGKIVASKAAINLTPTVLELGGKNPVIVNDFKDLELVAKRIAWAKLLNAGQTCIAPDYLLIKEGLENPFVMAYHQAVVEFYGDYILTNVDYPKIINQKHFDRLISLVNQEQLLNEYWTDNLKITPILVKANINSPIMEEEIFGPILPILTYKKIDKAIDIVQSMPKPLALYLFSDDKQVIDKVLNSLSFGSATINDTIKHFINPNLPFGGIGDSGMGAYHGKKTFDTFTHYKGVLKSSTLFKNKIPYFPSSKRKLKLLKWFLK